MLPESAAVDQVVRVRYRKVYTVQGLGAAVSTTLPACGGAHAAARLGVTCLSYPLPAAVAAAEHGAE